MKLQLQNVGAEKRAEKTLTMGRGRGKQKCPTWMCLGFIPKTA
jgi:hypothetical protein